MFICVPVEKKKSWHVFEVLELAISPARVLRPCERLNECMLVAHVKEPGARIPYEERQFILMSGVSWQAINVFKCLIEKREGYSDKETYFMLVDEAKKQTLPAPDPFK